ncbi:MAG TPA: ribonuclease HI family protein [Candidatus Krumholzibacteria bacterium]|nr:ribonuclease HI family protein [Candidatus Krumholzibacteria bacterium]HPD71106.1 ribonuclease HI family protein [Candidatus Krumholzibacteria bacterium]HRY39194.1 ribonuclease HI family protein [Candidatus Krumholzibacteria bacterium]
MTESKGPETLSELLRTLERSEDLRRLARDCGLSVRELRRRLAHWRRELKEDQAEPAAALAAAKKEPFPGLPAAADLPECPLPATGSPVLEIFTDGASRGNPGPAAIGVLFRQKDGPDLCAHREAIGRATNNQAEYRAVLAALEHCDRWGVGRVHLYLDSELVARQLMGTYRVKSQDLLPLYQQAVHLAKRLREFRIRHVPRAKNAHADHLANQALDPAK